MSRHGTPEEMRNLTRFLQDRGWLSRTGLMVTVGCVVESVPYPLRVTALKFAKRPGGRSSDTTVNDWLKGLDYGTVVDVDGDLITVRWDTHRDQTQLLVARELLLMSGPQFERCAHKPARRLAMFGPDTEWWKGVDRGQLHAAAAGLRQP